jgi:hypothetical protein
MYCANYLHNQRLQLHEQRNTSQQYLVIAQQPPKQRETLD